jgi:hypothetical protein
VAIAESLDDAIDKWDRVIAGEEVCVETGERGRGCHSITVFKPPPSLGVEVAETSVTPPPWFIPPGPESTVHVESFGPSNSQVSGDGMKSCSGCRQYHPAREVVTVKSRSDGLDVRLCNQCRGEEPEEVAEPEASRQVSLESSSSLSQTVAEEIVEHVRVEGTASVVSVLGELQIDPAHREAVADVVAECR